MVPTVYRADVTNNKTHEHKYYYGISDTQFKGSYEIVMMFPVPNLAEINTLINNWYLCLNEKDFIIRNLDEVNMLSKRLEFISKSQHITKRSSNRVKDDSNDWLWSVFIFTVCLFVLLMKSFCFCR